MPSWIRLERSVANENQTAVNNTACSDIAKIPQASWCAREDGVKTIKVFSYNGSGIV